LFGPPNSRAALDAVDPARLSEASAFFYTANTLANYVGVTLVTELLGQSLVSAGGLDALQSMLGAQDPPALTAAYLAGQSIAYDAVIACVIVGLLIALIPTRGVLERVPRIR
jgi:hypothetical protein